MQVVAVEPPAGELVQGLRNLEDGFVPPIFDPSVLDRKFIVRPRESIEWLGGCSTSARCSPASRRAPRSPARRRWPPTMDAGTIVTLLPDGGWKYLSSGAWTDRHRRRRGAGDADQLLVSPPDPRPDGREITHAAAVCATAGSWRSPRRPSTASAPTRRRPPRCAGSTAVKGRPRRPSRDRARGVGGPRRSVGGRCSAGGARARRGRAGLARSRSCCGAPRGARRGHRRARHRRHPGADRSDRARRCSRRSAARSPRRRRTASAG